MTILSKTCRILSALVLFAALAPVHLALADTAAALPAGDHALLMQLASQVASDHAAMTADRAVITDLRSQLAAQQAKLNAVSVTASHAALVAEAAQPAASTSYGPFTVSGKNVYLTDYNLYIRSGSGSTSGKVNGYGNLIIGYDESRGSGKDNRTGSHNLVVGTQANFTSYGGIIAGYSNSSLAPYASVTGGRSNLATGDYSSVTGGDANTASDDYASVTGGNKNVASGEYAAVSGGYSNTAAGQFSLAGGGYSANASGEYASCVGSSGANASGFSGSTFGGFGNQATGTNSSVTGGYGNTAIGYASTVSGGNDEAESGEYYWRGGTYESE